MKAFPNLQLTVSEMGQVRAINEVNTGMDLRDYFAAYAMCGLTSKYGNDGDHESKAMESYKLADIMMKAREVK